MHMHEHTLTYPCNKVLFLKGTSESIDAEADPGFFFKKGREVEGGGGLNEHF